MSPALPVTRVTYAEYLVAEEKSPARSEFINGEIVAMSGGTPEHGALASAFGGELRVALKNRPCRVFSSDVRVRGLETNFAAYPDVSVVCGRLETSADDANAMVNPCLLVEVLSASTEAYDRGAKAVHYRRIPSLGEYVLVSQHEPLIEVYRRNEHGRWELYEFRSGQTVELASLQVSIDVDMVYQNPLSA